MEHQSSRDAYTVAQFCQAHGFSRALFYRLLAEGRGPKLIKLGKRTLISRESAAEWRAEMEAATAAKRSA